MKTESSNSRKTSLNGQAVFNKTFVSVGTKSITAVYSGDANFTGTTSAAVSQQVGQAATTTTLTSSMNPSAVGQSVTFTAMVTPQFGGTPTGTVTFMNGTVTIGTVTVTNGQASINKVFPAAGAKTITTTYSGDANFTSSSTSVTQSVQ